MDLSGSAQPYYRAAFGEDAGLATDVDMLSGVFNVLQHHMNLTVDREGMDSRTVVRSFSHQLRNTLNNAGEQLLAFLRPSTDTDPLVPCVADHRTFLSGLKTSGFLSSPSWMARNVREMVDHDAMDADISGVLGISIPTLRSKLREAMDLYLASIAKMETSYKRLELKLTNVADVTRQLLSLPPLHSCSLEAAILAYAEAHYKDGDIEADYVEFCKNYAAFQAYRSVLTLVQGPGAPTCVICMTEPVSCAIVPCGHTFCTKCAQTQRSHCYLCRTPVREKQRLYFT